MLRYQQKIKNLLQLEKVFVGIKRILKPNAKLLITVQDSITSPDPCQSYFFTKGRLAQILDKYNFWIERFDSLDRKGRRIIRAVVSNIKKQNSNKKRRICALGAYGVRYNELGYDWDGQARAFKKLDVETLLLDIRQEKDFGSLKEKVLGFHPDILWIALKDGLPFLIKLKKELGKLDFKVVYWFRDLRGIEGVKSNLPIKSPKIDPIDIQGVIDYVFLSSAGQIEDYKRIYGVNKVYFMPDFCSPEFMHKVDVKEKYNIVFTGGLEREVFHGGRTRLIRNLMRHYNLQVRNNILNNIAEFYSSSKIVFGADVIGKDKDFQPYLYTSNRFFIALACGSFYLCQYFPGIEKLAENHKHLVWFKNEKELYDLIDYYLEHDKERKAIGRNAQELAHSKHANITRIQNILDIIDGKTEEFYGFIK